MRTNANKDKTKLSFPNGVTYQTLRLYNEKKRSEGQSKKGGSMGIIKR